MIVDRRHRDCTRTTQGGNGESNRILEDHGNVVISSGRLRWNRENETDGVQGGLVVDGELPNFQTQVLQGYTLSFHA